MKYLYIYRDGRFITIQGEIHGKKLEKWVFIGYNEYMIIRQYRRKLGLTGKYIIVTQ